MWRGGFVAMNQTMRWACLAAGILLAIQGVRRVVLDGDWVLLILAVLILAFSASNVIKNRQSKP
jgi:hypothetical protein